MKLSTDDVILNKHNETAADFGTVYDIIRLDLRKHLFKLSCQYNITYELLNM